MRKKVIVPTNCFFKVNYNEEYESILLETKKKCYKYNQINPKNIKKQQKKLQNILGEKGTKTVINPPFWCDYGYNMKVGDYFYAGHNFIVQDGGGINIGNNVFIGPNCCLTTAEHPLDPELRKEGYEVALPITIGNNVWIGANVTVLAGVTIGDNAVIGAGSVVKKDIPSKTVAVGVPCKVLRKITEEEKNRYNFYNDKL